jgi:hypothetical protein
MLFLSTLLLFLVFGFLVNISTPVALKTFKIGDVIESDIHSTKAFIDQEAFELLKQSVMDAVMPVTTIDVTVQLSIRQKINEFYDHLRAIKTEYADEKQSVLQKIYIATVRESSMAVTEDTLKALITLSEQTITANVQTVNEVVSQVMAEGVSEAQLPDAKLRISETLSKLEVPNSVREATDALIGEYLISNIEIDIAKTEARRQKALAELVPPQIEKAALLALKGQVIDQKLSSLLTAAGYGSYSKGARLIYTITTYLSLVLILGLYYSFSSTYLNKGLTTKKILLSTTLLIITTVINHFAVLTSPYLIHICLYTLTLCLFYDRLYAVIISIILVALTAMVEPVHLSFLIYGPLSAIACGLMLKEIHQRGSILYSGIVISLFSVVIGGLFLLVSGDTGQVLIREVLFLGVAGVFYSILAIGTLPIWEFVFKLLTPIKLLELSSPNQPLLKHLLIEAPGTYHHSIIVGNLSDEAARAVSADSLLARVGAYYHDIGKTYKPYFFKENQLGIDNPHDRMSAYMSAGVIKNHVDYGVKLAQSHHLPEEIAGFISSHHGTTIIKYFYHKALKDQKDVDIKDFSYEGDLPLTKEMAIVMLADTVEAVSRTLEVHNPQQHEIMLTKVFQDKFETGQLKHSPLTFADLEKIKNAFLKTLSGLYHDRIIYPEDIVKGEPLKDETVN